MHAAAVTSRLRGATNSARHSTLPSLALSSTRIFPPFPSCCTAAPTASCRRRERPLVPAALFHTSRPLFAPADLPSPFAAVSSEVEPVNLADSHTDVVEESPETYQDSGRSRSDSALDLTCEASISQSAGRFNLPVTAATPGRKLPSRSQGLSSDCESMSPSSLPSAASPATTALVKTDTVTLVSPVTGAMSVISTIDAIPTCTVSLASPSSSAFRAPEAVAVARGLRASAQSSGRDGKTFPSIRKVWLLEEGKRFHDSVEAAERDIILDRPDCSSRALDFAAACGEANQALVVNPMELVIWVADTLRPTDPGIDEYLNLILFPDLDHHTFPGSEELCWSSPTRTGSESSPPSSPSRTGRSTPASRSLAVRQVENDRRFSNIHAVLDRGTALLSQQLTGFASPPVLILDHAGVFIGSPQGHTLFDALEASFKHNLFPSHPSLRMIYNVTSPSVWDFDTYMDLYEDTHEECRQVLWERRTPDALTLRLDPDVRLDHSRLVLQVFRAHWQAQYINLRLQRAPGMPADARVDIVHRLRDVLGDARWATNELNLVALAMIGLESEARAEGTDVFPEFIYEHAQWLLGKTATRAAREAAVKRALEAEGKHKERMSGSAADEEDAPHGFPPHLPPFLQVENNALPFVRPESISVTLDDVVGQAQAKQALDALITLPMKHPEQFSSGVLSLTSAAGVLLYGPPGTGKTMLAKAVAKSAGATFIAMNPSDIQDKFVGESEKTIKRLFETARRKAPCVIFLDEVDALFSKRDFDRQGYRRDILNEFCMQWDGIKGSKNVIVLGATNRPFDLDEAVLRRFSRRVLVDLPSATEKRHLLVSLLKDETLESPDLIDSLLPQLVHHSASDIKNVAIAAAMAAVRERPVGPRVLGRRHFDAALKDVRPSVSNAMDAIVKLREFASTMEGDGSGLKRVGFSFADIGKGLVDDEGRT